MVDFFKVWQVGAIIGACKADATQPLVGGGCDRPSYSYLSRYDRHLRFTRNGEHWAISHARRGLPDFHGDGAATSKARCRDCMGSWCKPCFQTVAVDFGIET